MLTKNLTALNECFIQKTMVMGAVNPNPLQFHVNPSRPNPRRREKIYSFIFTLLCGTSKGFIKALGPHKTFRGTTKN